MPVSLLSRSTNRARSWLLLAALVGSLVAAIIAHLATLFVYFVGNQFAEAIIPQANNAFLYTSVIAFVVLFILGLFGVFRWWFTALIGGFFAVLIGAFFGTLIVIVTAGTAVSTDTLGLVFGSLTGYNLTIIVAFTIAAATVGRAVALWVQRLGTGKAGRKILIVRRPASNLSEGMVTHIERTPIDAEKADEQWSGYVAALEEFGWQVEEAPVADTLPDSVFIEDAVIIVDDIAIVGNPGSDHRKDEVQGIDAFVSKLGLDPRFIVEPGTLDGGDVLKVGNTIYVGRTLRTNGEGISQFRDIVAPLGYTVIPVPVTRALHLKSAVTALPDGSIIGYLPLVDDPNLFERFRAIPEAHGAAVVVLDPGTVLMSASATQTIDMLEDLGYTVITVDISEFEKLEGCVTCLSVRVR
jgi:dimethylargininase